MDNWVGKRVNLNPDMMRDYHRWIFERMGGVITLHYEYLVTRPDVDWEVMAQADNLLTIRPDGLDATIEVLTDFLIEVIHA